tara:strand:- start:2382 stop:3449 length:1068 start_codon:yes stop_codon:yes gene_type:complete
MRNQTLGTKGNILNLNSDILGYFPELNTLRKTLDADIFPTFDTAVVLADLNLIITDLEALPVTAAISGTITTSSMTPGVYTIAGAATINGTLTLDGTGVTDAMFVIIGSAAISTGASARIVLVNTLPENVHFLATGAWALGANTVMNGNILSKAGAPSLGAGCTVVGRMLTLAGAVSSDSSSLILPTSAGVTINYRSCFEMVMFTGTTAVTNAGGVASYYEGDIASHTGTVTGFSLAGGVFTIYPPGISTPNQNNYLPFQTGGVVVFGEKDIIIYIFPAANIEFTGFDSTDILDNYEFTIVNLGVGTATLKNLSPDSTNDNKIAADTDIILKQYQGKDVTRVNGTLNKWLIKGNN